MSRHRAAGIGMLALFAAVLVAVVPPVQARPTYFDIFTQFYGIGESDRLHACGVCHFRWEGTGGRNLYGTTIELEIYNGTPIAQAIVNVEGMDPDNDGFTSVDEIVNFETLPGYSCGNFFDAIDAPADYHTYITPMVATCLEPLDIRVVPTQSAVIAAVGDTTIVPITLFNNGSDFAVDIASYGMLAGTDPTLTVSGPAAPFSIPVGQSVVLDVAFTPLTPTLATGTLRISSNDPDEANVDVTFQAIGFIQPVAPPEERAACLGDVDKHFGRYSKSHFREWVRCYEREVTGRACDAGRRDQKTQQAAARFRAFVGGSQDSRCAGNGLTPSLLDIPDTCGGACGHIDVNTIAALADCLVCRQDEAVGAMLSASLGTAPPDLPPNLLVGGAASCQKQLLRAVRKGIEDTQESLGGCELANITAGTPVDCATDQAASIQAIQTRVDGRIERCSDTTGMLGCLFPPPMETPDPSCLGDATVAIGSDLVDAAFGLED